MLKSLSLPKPLAGTLPERIPKLDSGTSNMPSKPANPKLSRLRLALPATSANLGPAFDSAALAMDFYIKIDARAAEEFPIAKGCGSSAAARLAGIALAVRFGRLRWTDAQIVGEASRREHHPDNASACWMGGLTVAQMSSESEAQVVCVHPKGKWPLLLAVPEQALSTEEARRVLPAHY